MNKQNLLVILGIVFGLYFVLRMTFNFLDIPFYKYGIFLYWMISIAILAVVLPQKTGQLFS